ncbi:MAG: YihA family ribosome biogenesis GTP-binding protein [Saprospiraceae bacterium]|nr:YihA family ribosome biogenesis GTP-binding protein [Saprospiraceae bacterium]
MEINSGTYLASYVREEQCPQGEIPEIAFIGRSNVGKSSLINMLCGMKDLAKTSKQPGKTQKLNYFVINESWHLVDLPGYGYAKISQKTREEWSKMIRYYLRHRKQLYTAFVLIDARHTLQKIDEEFVNWCGAEGIPIAIIYTKADKTKEKELEYNIRKIEEKFLKTWEELPRRFITSSISNMGREEILAYIDEVINKKPQTP